MPLILLLTLLLIFSFSSIGADPLEKPFKESAKKIVNNIAKDKFPQKRLVILNFVNDELDTTSNERQLGVYLAKLFSYYVGEECGKRKIELRKRALGEIATLEEMKYRKPTPSESLFSLLQLFEADYCVVGTYHLYENELEIQELIALLSIGSKEVGRTKPIKIKLSPEEYKRMKQREDVIVPWKQIDPKLLTFLTKDGNWDGVIREIEVLDFYTRRPITSEVLRLDQYIKISIDLDSLPVFLYVIGWDQELKRISFLYPNEYEKTNPVTRQQIMIPSSDDLALPIKGPIKNKEVGDYNWIKVFVSRQPITSFPVMDGFISETDARLKNINDELESLGLQNWSSKMIDFWVKEK